MDDAIDTDEEETNYTADELINVKAANTRSAYQKLDHVSPHSLPARISSTIFAKFTIPAFLTILALEYLSPVIVGILAVAVWILRYFDPKNISQRIRGGYIVTKEHANGDSTSEKRDEDVLYELFEEVCAEFGYNPEKYTIIVHDSKGAASADPNNNNIFLTTDTLDKLTKTELKSVFAHELMHTNHSPLLNKLFTLTAIPLPLFAVPLAFTPLNQNLSIFFVVLFLLAALKTTVSLLIKRRMEIEADAIIPEYYHHHYAYALAVISEQTPHIQTTVGKHLYSFLDEHAPLNKRIESIVDITLPRPSDATNPTPLNNLENLVSVIIPILLSIGLAAHFTITRYEIASGVALMLLLGLLLVIHYEKLYRKRYEYTPKRLGTLAILPIAVLAIGYELATILFNRQFYQDGGTTLQTTLNTLSNFGIVVNDLVLGVLLIQIILAAAGVFALFKSSGKADPGKYRIHDDSNQEQLLRNHYNETSLEY